jgi:hypothetical protein
MGYYPPPLDVITDRKKLEAWIAKDMKMLHSRGVVIAVGFCILFATTVILIWN